MNALETRRQVQLLLKTVPDGILGPKSLKAFRDLAQAPAGAEWPEVVHKVWATSFADPKDIAAFKRCKAEGHTDKFCLGRGDNGVGTPKLGILQPNGTRKGVDTTQSIPMCALPPDDWEPLGDQAPGALVVVTRGNLQVVCQLRDTMPRKEAIKNGALIDLNPAACAQLGLIPPVKAEVEWRWA